MLDLGHFLFWGLWWRLSRSFLALRGLLVAVNVWDPAVISISVELGSIQVLLLFLGFSVLFLSGVHRLIYQRLVKRLGVNRNSEDIHCIFHPDANLWLSISFFIPWLIRHHRVVEFIRPIKILINTAKNFIGVWRPSVGLLCHFSLFQVVFVFEYRTIFCYTLRSIVEHDAGVVLGTSWRILLVGLLIFLIEFFNILHAFLIILFVHRLVFLAWGALRQNIRRSSLDSSFGSSAAVKLIQSVVWRWWIDAKLFELLLLHHFQLTLRLWPFSFLFFALFFLVGGFIFGQAFEI